MSLVEQYREWLVESPVPGAKTNNKVDSAVRGFASSFSNHKELRSGANRLGPGPRKDQLVRNLGFRNTMRRTAIVSDAVKRAKNLGFKQTK
jgi:hypothetical protein